MGYESRVYVINEGNIDIGYGKPICETIATIELSKCGNDLLSVFKTEATQYIIADGDVVITEDKYGDTLKSADIQDVIDVIKDGDYWRTDMLKSALISIVESYKSKNLTRDLSRLKVYHFGY